MSPGEDLETIAQKLYGDKRKWPLIFAANDKILPNSPRKSLGKMKIVIPVIE